MVLASTLPVAASAPAPLTLEQRIDCQRRIENVYWSRRTWPKENPGRKPSLDAVLPDAVIRGRVESTLRMSALLDTYWHRPLRAEHLQAEIDRMARQTRAPDVLRELFHALDDDASLVAECLAHPALARRYATTSFAGDERIHGRQRAAIEAELARGENAFAQASGEHSTVTYVLGTDDAQRGEQSHVTRGAIVLSYDAWKREMDALDHEIESPRGLRLLDRGDRFVAVRVLQRSAASVTIESVTWRKQSLEDWARGTAAGEAPSIPPPARGYALPAVTATGCTDEMWTPVPESLLPGRRHGHSAIWTGAEMLVWGGDDGNYQDTGGRYDPATDSWSSSSLVSVAGSNVPIARSGHTAVWTGTEMIVWGGIGMNTGGRFNPATDSWAACSLTRGTGANVPEGRSAHTAVWTGNEMIVWGGTSDYARRDLNSGARYDPVTDRWSAMAGGPNLPFARSHHTAVWTGTEMIVWGGAATKTGGRYSPALNAWIPSSLLHGMGANVPAARSLHTAVWTGTEMIVWGGYDGASDLKTGGRYRPSNDTWAASSLNTGAGANVPPPRAGHNAIWTGSEMIVWGGGESMGLRGTGGRFRPATDDWAACSLTTGSGANAPLARLGHAAVWTGTEMIVWGGHPFEDPDHPLDTGGRYDPSSDTWAASVLNAGAGPLVASPRRGHVAVWTGAEMLIWGGDDWNGVLGTGGRYDPATDAWIFSLLTVGGGAYSPTARSRSVAVWTGTEMIVWGGHGSGGTVGYLKNGGRYDPTLDDWKPTSLLSDSGANVPAQRVYHAAVWTGSEMIVWGGVNRDPEGGPDIHLDTGGRFDPASDAWVSCSLTTGAGDDVPAGRKDFTAIWTGREMIVWGGRTDATSFADGGRYSPASDAWAACSLSGGTGANVPLPRCAHTAVWAGTEMIVWGGVGSAFFADGGRYDPATDAWLPSSLTTGTGEHVPTPRAYHSATWNGTEMIVWGGYPASGDDSRDVNSGGRYDATGDAWAATNLVSRDVPSPRSGNTTIWTGSEMIVWGGRWYNSGGRYCAVPCTPRTWYRDGDGDGSGAVTVARTACAQPSGYVSAAGDCDDAEASAWARPGEVAALTLAADRIDLGWSPVAAPGAVAANYDVLRSNAPNDFGADATCVASAISGTSTTDGSEPSAQRGLFYLVRAVNACPGEQGAGPLGYSSSGSEIAGRACP